MTRWQRIKERVRFYCGWERHYIVRVGDKYALKRRARYGGGYLDTDESSSIFYWRRGDKCFSACVAEIPRLLRRAAILDMSVYGVSPRRTARRTRDEVGMRLPAEEAGALFALERAKQ